MTASARIQTLLLAVVVVFLCFTNNVSSQRSSAWKTLSGDSPLIIAHNGMSGLFPDGTIAAYQFAQQYGSKATVMYCDVQLTKDGDAVCRTNVILDNSTVVPDSYANKNSTYMVNGQKITGLFVLDLTSKEVYSFTARQAYQARSYSFDGLYSLIDPVQVWENLPVEPRMWLNLQYPTFYAEHNLSLSSYASSAAKAYNVSYISSPEVEFLKGIAGQFSKSNTKLVLKILGSEDIEPSTNQTYGSILKNLTFVKTFASGILLSKNYIWPTKNLYLQTPTGLVEEAHTAGLEVYASDFANDEYAMSYNYSYDPTTEYLLFMTNNYNFSVDGFLTDFSVTLTEAIGCYAHNTPPKSYRAGKPLIITDSGASGDYPGSTDIAYQAAISDGADIIDCNVQITKDSVVFCRESPNLLTGTTITSDTSFYPSRLKTVSQISNESAIYTFDLTWAEIQSLTPQTTSPFYSNYYLQRNPSEANAGKYMNLTEFLDFSGKQDNVSVIINIQYARAIIEARDLDLLGSTEKVLSSAKLGNKIIIKSDESAVLENLKRKTNYTLVYEVSEVDVSIPDSAIKQIKEYADVVSLTRSAILPADADTFFLLGQTDVVERFHKQNMSVYVYVFRNEYPALAFDYLSNPRTELNAFVDTVQVDGLITQFPASAKAYLENRCRFESKNKSQLYVVEPRLLLDIITPTPAPLSPPPALSPIGESPLPTVGITAPAPSPSNASAPSTANNNTSGSYTVTPPTFLSSLLLLSGLYLMNLQ